MSVPFTQLYIDGRLVPSSTSETFDVRSSYSGDVVGTAASASSADCRAAIEAAAKAFKTWEQTSLVERRDLFLKAASIVETEKWEKKLLQVVPQETSCAPYWVARHAHVVANMLRTQAGMVNFLRGEIYPSETAPGAQAISKRRAKGVVLGIAPWNAPFPLTVNTIAAPIISGNTVVFKSSELSPRSQSLVVDLFEEAGLPAGVFNFISISRENAPALTAEIIAHPAVRITNFTGSDRVGKIIAMESAKHLKPCVLELGGKAPAVVLDDANVIEAAKAIVWGAMAHSGQVCMSTERVIVQSGIADRIVSAIKELSSQLKAGDVLGDPAPRLGALFSESSADSVVQLLQDAKQHGAEIILGDTSKQGAVVQPHLVTNVKPGMRIWEKESFGPVIVFAVVNSVDEAIELANASDYSLSASLWTSDLYAAQSLAAQIRAGATSINGSTIHTEGTDSLLGLGGASGYGRFHIESYTDKRVIVTHPLGRQYPLFM
ncbi:unnamed protein product [Cyclocybe aegerita]|uniref:Aldehyde dehydrogenase domain-containing protein n=1 Tax=Cyclocybe aegerita TaxID=1973307 RepID=A0A8S0W388_CYCAE|nr:unnamed protein product [Cyclocybe aegerita]